MDEAAAVRRAAREAVDDVDPDSFRDDIDAFVADDSPVPGVLTLLAAAAADADPAAHTERAAAVQLIYDGLRLTRRLADDPPWTGAANAGTPDERDSTREQADIDILAADVLVARGFSLMADTEAATDAVGVVQSFGRTQTKRQAANDPPVDRELEANVLELALVAGATAGGATPRDPGTLARELVTDADAGLPTTEALFDPAASERIAAVTGGAGRPLNRND